LYQRTEAECAFIMSRYMKMKISLTAYVTEARLHSENFSNIHEFDAEQYDKRFEYCTQHSNEQRWS
jgi:hypothetical protein